jgi:hypothetical protein
VCNFKDSEGVFSSLLQSGNFGPHSKKVGPQGVLDGFWRSFLNKECVGHTVALPFTLTTILRKKKKIMKIPIFLHAKI